MSGITNLINNNQEIFAISALLFAAVFVIWNAFLQYSLIKFKKQTKVFFEGKGGKDLEEIIYKHIEKVSKMENEIEKIEKENVKAKENLSKCIQKTGVVRFNPFGDVGGNQSFVIALLDNFLNGVIILSLYSRDGVRVYSKQVKEGKSEYKLSKEEEEAIKKAIEGK